MRLTDKQASAIMKAFGDKLEKMVAVFDAIKALRRKQALFDENDNLLYSADELYESLCGDKTRRMLESLSDDELDRIIALCKEIKKSRK